ncbi:phosphotransferase [Micromonospora sp. HSS6-12]|uniref:Phosphotransferase n=1 Tax=Micromonospora thermarum TaxID=2720024 RepID=A0ABX0Z047_9ACTN|nr:phosphotransferase [Micromonospora thermarum]
MAASTPPAAREPSPPAAVDGAAFAGGAPSPRRNPPAETRGAMRGSVTPPSSRTTCRVRPGPAGGGHRRPGVGRGLARWAAAGEGRVRPALPGGVRTDLMPGNLLVRDGRLAVVIDLGTVCVGDPAVDLMPAWNLLPPARRERYRRALAVDDATWARGQGWALVQAVGALAYYVDSNPPMSATARHTLAAILADHEG